MQEQINLTIPKGWNQCTPSQLEALAAIMQEQIAKVDRYHPFDMQKVKIAVFFLFSGISINAYPDPRLPLNEQHYLVSIEPQKKSLLKKLLSLCAPVPSDSIAGPQSASHFPLYLWQLNYWLSPKAKTDDKTSLSISPRAQVFSTGWMQIAVISSPTSPIRLSDRKPSGIVAQKPSVVESRPRWFLLAAIPFR